VLERNEDDIHVLTSSFNLHFIFNFLKFLIMKVLRTALFCAFLMICFMNVGHAQQFPIQYHEPITEAEDEPIEIELNVDDIAYVVPAAPQYFVVKFDVTAPPNSTITIREQTGGAVLFTANLSDWPYSHAVIKLDAVDSTGTIIDCEVCDEENFACRQQGCVTATGVQTP